MPRQARGDGDDCAGRRTARADGYRDDERRADDHDLRQPGSGQCGRTWDAARISESDGDLDARAHPPRAYRVSRHERDRSVARPGAAQRERDCCTCDVTCRGAVGASGGAYRPGVHAGVRDARPCRTRGVLDVRAGAGTSTLSVGYSPLGPASLALGVSAGTAAVCAGPSLAARWGAETVSLQIRPLAMTLIVVTFRLIHDIPPEEE